MAFTAAELQKRHGLEGAPDPFPTLGNGPAPSKPKQSNGASTSNGESAPAVDSAEAFPSLGSSAAPAQSIAAPAASMWAKGPSSIKTSKSKAAAPGGLGRSGAPTANSHPFSDTFSLPSADIATGKALAETLKKVQDQTGAIVESSTQMATGLKTFHVKAADQKRLVYARRIIERGLSKPVTIEVEVPISTLGTIIGPKGATLKGITDSTQCKIDIPRRDTLPAYEPKEKEDGEEDEEDDEPQVNITVSGPSAACADAKAKILGLISHKISQSSTSIKNIPSSYYPFIAGPKGSKAKELEEEYGDVKIHVPPPAVWKALEKQGEEEEGAPATDRDVSIKVRGNKESVKAVVELFQNQYRSLSEQMRELKISIPKRQHRFLVGNTADRILSKFECIVELPPVEDPSDVCVIRGPQQQLIPALTIVMDEANAVTVEMVDVVAIHRAGNSDPFTHAKRVLRFLQRSSKLRSLGTETVKVFPPFASAVVASNTVVVEIVGADKDEVAKVKTSVVDFVKSVSPATLTAVEIDSLVHALLIGKKGSKIAQFESANNVTTVFPPQSDESSEVLLVYTGSSTDKKATKDALTAASAALQELAKGAADLKTETLTVDKKWHRAIIGPGGTILNALIGEDQAVIVKVGAQKDDASNEDVVTVRGPSTEVDRVIEQIKQIVEDAKNDDIINGFTAELSVDKKHVPHLVGQGGSTINKLRETLGVKVNFDDAEDKKGKKTVACKIVGRKEAVEEAKKRIIAQIEKLEDETTETITIKRAIQPALIGSSGKYAIRLEEKYGVKLSFPRDGKDGTSPSNPDEVVIRGGKKGVAAVKAELLEAAAFETESRQSLTFTIPTRAVSQVVGKGGQVINGIKDETGAQIDIDKKDDGGKTTIVVRGDKKAIAAAKASILSVAESVGEETSTEVFVPQKYHRSLIGQGGQKLRDLIVSCGGPEEAFRQSGLVTFPKAGNEDMDTVKLRGEKGLVAKIKAEFEKQVKTLKETKIEGVVVPKDQHAGKIGRGGMALQSLQRESGATIHFPGSRQYGSVGEIENDLPAETDAADIVKVIGTKEAIAKAKESLETFVQRPARNESGRGTPDQSSRSIPIPKKYYHALADQQNLLRQIRSAGGFLTLPQPAPPKNTFKPSAAGSDPAAKSARIDVDGGDDAQAPVEGNWEVRENHMEGGDETIDWTVRAKSEEDLGKAIKVLEGALKGAKSATHVGLLTGLPRSAFPRIIGSKGATISRLRSDIGADIQVGKDDDLITITGDEASVNQAKDAILSIVQRPSQQNQRY